MYNKDAEPCSGDINLSRCHPYGIHVLLYCPRVKTRLFQNVTEPTIYSGLLGVEQSAHPENDRSSQTFCHIPVL